MTKTSKRRIAAVVLATLVAAAVFMASTTFVLDDVHGVGIQGVGNTGNG